MKKSFILQLIRVANIRQHIKEEGALSSWSPNVWCSSLTLCGSHSMNQSIVVALLWAFNNILHIHLMAQKYPIIIISISISNIYTLYKLSEKNLQIIPNLPIGCDTPGHHNTWEKTPKTTTPGPTSCKTDHVWRYDVTSAAIIQIYGEAIWTSLI